MENNNVLIKQKPQNSNEYVQKAISLAVKTPGVKIDRKKFLEKELLGYFPKETINKAIAHNPAYAKIPKKFINATAKKIISYETNKVSAISFVAGMPGGLAMMATIPADTAQYFGFILRVMQKLAYLYGFDDFELNEENIKDDTMNKLLIFLGVMFGVKGANAGIKFIAKAAADRVLKVLPRKALMKTPVYPLIKRIAVKVGIQMNKTIFANEVSKIIPVVGGILTGTMTYVTFRPLANNLKKSFESLPLCDPNSKLYKKE